MSPADAEAYPWHGPVPRVESDQDFEALRALLADYNEAGICAHLKLPNLQAYAAPSQAELAETSIGSQFDALIRLFLSCLYVPEAALSPDALALLDRLGLIARSAERPGEVYAAAAILPAFGELTVCDRGNAPDGSHCALPPDVVYPAIFENTRHYLNSLPRTPCDAMLELGTGTGIAAILGARHARHVWATDITGRAVAFAELNCRLAGRRNVTLATGDMYAPVEGLTFDRIAIHPPYVPARQSKFIFRDAGEDGSAIIRRAIEGLPQFLRPGGRFYSILLAYDREGQTFEQRVRTWLGPSQAEYDVVVAAHSWQSPREFLEQYRAKGPTSEDDVQFWIEMWKATRTEAVLYTSLILERHVAARELMDLRLRTGAGYNAAALEAVLAWEAVTRGPDAADRLLASRPVASPHCVLHTTSRIRDGKFAVDSMNIEVSGPFRVLLTCDWWLAQIVSQCDGTRSVADLFAWGRASQVLPETVAETDFCEILAALLRKGFVRCEG